MESQSAEKFGWNDSFIIIITKTPDYLTLSKNTPLLCALVNDEVLSMLGNVKFSR